MTVIAWDGRTLATDSRSNSGSQITSNRKQKLFDLTQDGRPSVYYEGDILLACGLCGKIVDMYKLLDQISDLKDSELELDVAGIFIGLNKAYLLERGECHLIPYPLDQKLTEGSGGEFALAAMALKRNAVQAVKLAIKLDSACGGEIQTWSYPNE